MAIIDPPLGEHHPSDGPLRKTRTTEQWRAVIAVIAERHGFSSGELAPFSTGSDVVWGAADFVVKLSCQRWVDEIAAEVEWLRYLEDRISVETPRVLAHGEVQGWPYLIMSRLVGYRSVDEVWSGLDHASRLELATSLGETIAELHSLPVAGIAHDWPGFIAELRATVIERHQRDELEPAWLEGVPDILGAATDTSSELVLVHTELLEHHILLTQEGNRWRVGGLIDFADARIAHPLYEIAAPIEFIFKGEPGCLRACATAIGWQGEELGRPRSRELAAWGLLHRFGSLSRALRAAGDIRPGDWDGLIDSLYRLEPRA